MQNRKVRSAKYFLFLTVWTSMATAGRDAHAAEPIASDGKALVACLDLVKKNAAARGLHGLDELTEERGPEGRLRAARDAAPRQAESCIGVVAVGCIQAKGKEADYIVTQCYRREEEAWDSRLNATYLKLLEKDDGESADGFRNVQRSWIAFRDARCRQPHLVFKGTMAVPIEAYCRLHLTARQALWLEGWLE